MHRWLDGTHHCPSPRQSTDNPTSAWACTTFFTTIFGTPTTRSGSPSMPKTLMLNSDSTLSYNDQ
eukprot:m.189246 g.189246  ORF g.189246 m.189246 type:complete len:65 (+) comp32368_c0_seq1:2236-2430(+)